MTEDKRKWPGPDEVKSNWPPPDVQVNRETEWPDPPVVRVPVPVEPKEMFFTITEAENEQLQRGVVSADVSLGFYNVPEKRGVMFDPVTGQGDCIDMSRDRTAYAPGPPEDYKSQLPTVEQRTPMPPVKEPKAIYPPHEEEESWNRMSLNVDQLGDLGLTLQEMEDLQSALAPVERAHGASAGEAIRSELRKLANPTKEAEREFVDIAVNTGDFRQMIHETVKDTFKIGERKLKEEAHTLSERIRTQWNESLDRMARIRTATTVLVALFTSTVVVTNAVSGNLIHVGPFLFVAGTLSYPVTFLLTDILSEIFGKKVAQRAVILGFIAQLLSVAFIFGVMQFDSATKEMGVAFRSVFAPVFRIVIASMTAYLVAQTVDVTIFHFVKEKTKGRWLWLRNNVATAVAQGIDTLLFVVIAFAGVLPLDAMVAMFAGQYLAKVLLAIIDTPFCYLGVHIVRKYIK